MVLVTFLLLCAGIVFQERVSVIMEADMEDKLLEITAQIRIAVDQKLESNYAVLHAVAGFLENGQPSRAFMDAQKERGGFTSLGAVGLDGKGFYGPDMEPRYLPVLMDAFHGNDRIRWMEQSPFGETNCIFVTVPLERQKRVVGAVYAVYSEMDMPGLSSPDVFGGQGFSMIVGDGTGTDLPWKLTYDNGHTGELSRQANMEAGERMKQKLYQSRRGVEKFHMEGQETYFACMPLSSIPEWYVLTAIPATVVLRKINVMIRLMSAVVLGLCCALLALAWSAEWARRRNRRQFFELAYTDRLTGLRKWKGFVPSAQRLLEKRDYVLAVLDVDEFHIANNLLGMDLCDDFLRRAAKILTESARGDELVCRAEGDRFGFLMREGPDVEERLLQMMERVSGEAYGPGLNLSAGVVRLREEKLPLNEAAECCALAQKDGKGKNCCSVHFYRPEMRQAQDRSRSLMGGLSRALAEKELLVYFQPKARLRDGMLLGAEALVRWQHPVYGFLTAAEFVPLLERLGGIAQLDRYVLRAVCRLLREWEERGLPQLPVSVNLSRIHLAAGDLAEELWELTEASGVSADRIELEIPDAFQPEDREWVLKAAESLKEKGFRLSVDRYGSGCLIPGFSADTVKLDKSLLSPCDCLSGIIDMAHIQGKAVLAMGVEREEQVRMLLEAGCEQGQGFYYGRPMPPDGYERLLRDAERGLPHEYE